MAKYPPDVQELFERIAECLSQAIQLECCVFRSAGIRYSNETDLISGDGANYNGGRWNPPGMRAIYASLDPVTAMKESYQEFMKYGFKNMNIKPRVFVGIKLQLKCLLDLTNAKIRRKLKFNLTELIEEDWHAIQCGGEESWTQAISRGSLLAGFEGLLVPSAQHRQGKNIVIFPENLISTSIVKLMSKEELPLHPSRLDK